MSNQDTHASDETSTAQPAKVTWEGTDHPTTGAEEVPAHSTASLPASPSQADDTPSLADRAERLTSLRSSIVQHRAQLLQASADVQSSDSVMQAWGWLAQNMAVYALNKDLEEGRATLSALSERLTG